MDARRIMDGLGSKRARLAGSVPAQSTVGSCMFYCWQKLAEGCILHTEEILLMNGPSFDLGGDGVGGWPHGGVECLVG